MNKIGALEKQVNYYNSLPLIEKISKQRTYTNLKKKLARAEKEIDTFTDVDELVFIESFEDNVKRVEQIKVVLKNGLTLHEKIKLAHELRTIVDQNKEHLKEMELNVNYL